jgi:signal transduction histidine kinase
MPTSVAPARSVRLVSVLVGAEVALTAVELAWVGTPLCLAARGLGAGGPARAVIAVAVALWLATALRLYDGLRPVVALLAARARLESVPAADAEAAQRALARSPGESAWLRFGSWAIVSALALWLTPRAGDRLLVASAASAALLHAAGAASLRALLLERAFARLRLVIFPNLEAMRAWSAGYRTQLALLGLLFLGLGHVVLALFVGAFAPLGARPRAGADLLLWPVLLPGAVSWAASLRRRARPIEAYFDVTLRSPGTRGPPRDEPRAIAAFVTAQSLPYRLAGYHAFVVLLAGLLAVAAGRRLLGLPIGVAARLLGVLALVVALGAHYHVLLARRWLHPLMRHLGSRHHLPTKDIVARVGLRPKLLSAFGVVALAPAGLLLLCATAPGGAPGWAALALALGGAAVIGFVLLVARELVTPIRALEARSEEMARGELARPLPPAGEADEIGRLAVAFEEMRRALRDRLRSTESINVDLEREVRRRTEALEQRNAEVRDALEKLRRAQDNLVRSEKLASMGRLVAGIAHEINNPVNAIINSLGPLEETVREIGSHPGVGAAAASAEEMLAVVKRGAARTKAIVQALHNYSRGEETIPREVNLARSVDDTLDLLRHRLRAVTVIKDIEPGARIAGFPGQIDQVLMNLLTNAAQAIGEGGGTIRVSAAVRGDSVDISVADDGPGIPADVLPRIFDPFFTTKDVGEGSGLGLSIVHGIVDRHGGKIDVESVPGAGTTFRLSFPRAGALARASAGA